TVHRAPACTARPVSDHGRPATSPGSPPHRRPPLAPRRSVVRRVALALARPARPVRQHDPAPVHHHRRHHDHPQAHGRHQDQGDRRSRRRAQTQEEAPGKEARRGRPWQIVAQGPQGQPRRRRPGPRHRRFAPYRRHHHAFWLLSRPISHARCRLRLDDDLGRRCAAEAQQPVRRDARAPARDPEAAQVDQDQDCVQARRRQERRAPELARRLVLAVRHRRTRRATRHPDRAHHHHLARRARVPSSLDHAVLRLGAGQGPRLVPRRRVAPLGGRGVACPEPGAGAAAGAAGERRPARLRRAEAARAAAACGLARPGGGSSSRGGGGGCSGRGGPRRGECECECGGHERSL
ncbi:uncharacterized protein RHOBADRAFT_52265, partial [Rhodotorula graminis WP1]